MYPPYFYTPSSFINGHHALIAGAFVTIIFNWYILIKPTSLLIMELNI
jgi:hypothetical protein